MFQQLPELANRFLMPPDPVVLHYLIDPSFAASERPSAWDVEVKLDDLSLKNRMKNATLDANPATTKTLTEIDDEVRHPFPYGIPSHTVIVPVSLKFYRLRYISNPFTMLSSNEHSSAHSPKTLQSSFRHGSLPSLGTWKQYSAAASQTGLLCGWKT